MRRSLIATALIPSLVLALTAVPTARAETQSSGGHVGNASDQFAGGSLLGTRAELSNWVSSLVAELHSYDDVRVLQRTTAFGYYDDGFVLALEKRADHLPVHDFFALGTLVSVTLIVNWPPFWAGELSLIQNSSFPTSS